MAKHRLETEKALKEVTPDYRVYVQTGSQAEKLLKKIVSVRKG